MKPGRFIVVNFAIVVIFVSARSAAAQTVTQRGFIEGSAFLFARPAPDDPTQAVGDMLVREEVFAKPASWVQFGVGVDVRANSHDQVDDRWRIDVGDRGTLRPRLSLRRATATIARGWFELDAGKQFIRWGKTDIVTPTDRFAPRDFLNVVDNEFLAVTGVRASARISSDSIEVAWVPRFTPSRIPLVDQRWTAVSEPPPPLTVVDRGAQLPSGSQAGVRWSHVGDLFEYAVLFFDGFNHLPSIDIAASPVPDVVQFTRVYPRIRMFGGDAAIPTRWFTLKGESAYFRRAEQSPPLQAPSADDYVLYVIQLERQSGEWMLVGGYAGEIVTERRAPLTFAPDRGMTRALVGRASYTIDTNRSAAFEGAVRQNGAGAYARAEYSQARGQHWRATLAAVAIAGRDDDFLGQYRRNSHAQLSLRYSY
jgi:hypothetical protein